MVFRGEIEGVKMNRAQICALNKCGQTINKKQFLQFLPNTIMLYAYEWDGVGNKLIVWFNTEPRIYSVINNRVVLLYEQTDFNKALFPKRIKLTFPNG